MVFFDAGIKDINDINRNIAIKGLEGIISKDKVRESQKIIRCKKKV